MPRHEKEFPPTQHLLLSPPMSRSPLPYTDAKPVGAADFYFAINATFRFILEKSGMNGLRDYWTGLGSGYFAPVSDRWKKGGLAAVVEYWRAFFAAEPRSQVALSASPYAVTLEVKVCPAIAHLRAQRRQIVPCFCQHCYFVSEAMAEPAGLQVRIEGGNGQCRQVFRKRETQLPPQDFSKIREVAC